MVFSRAREQSAIRAIWLIAGHMLPPVRGGGAECGVGGVCAQLGGLPLVDSGAAAFAGACPPHHVIQEQKREGGGHKMWTAFFMYFYF